jgi:polyphenol oxidase
VHPVWAEELPWLVQGTTGVGDGDEPFDLGLSGGAAVGAVLDRWRRLRAAVGCASAVVSRQVHGAELARHGAGIPAGLMVLEGIDGHLTREPGLLLAVSVADCVPVSIVDPERRSIALVHAGWRGAAAGIVEAALRGVAAGDPEARARLRVHCGPSICGACYEVGPEVHRAVNPGGPHPEMPTPIDLPLAIASRVVAAGVPPGQVGRSAHCTRCGDGSFFSHRGGSPARQMGVLAIRG